MIYATERIKTLSQLAHIALDAEETERLRKELGAMHALAEALQNAPLEAEEEDPFLDAVPLDGLREDRPGTCLPPEKLLPESAEGCAYFTVPRAVEE